MAGSRHSDPRRRAAAQVIAAIAAVFFALQPTPSGRRLPHPAGTDLMPAIPAIR